MFNPSLPVVSVIVTSYNQSKTITQCLDSILNQKCDFLFEIIIGDDCSNDGTQKICFEYQKKFPEIIKPVYHTINRGVSTNWILSINEAKGKYIAACAADDFWSLPTKLQIQVDYLENDASIDFCFTDYDILYIDSKRVYQKKNVLRKLNIRENDGNYLFNGIASGKIKIATNTVLFKKEIIDKYIPVNDFIRLKFPIEDWPMWLIFAKYCNMKYIPISTAVYRKGHESLSNSTDYLRIEEKYLDEHRMYKYLCNLFPDELQYSEIIYQSYIYNILINLAFKKKDFTAAKFYGQRMKELGMRDIKTKMSQHFFTFYAFSVLKSLRNKIFNN